MLWKFFSDCLREDLVVLFSLMAVKHYDKWAVILPGFCITLCEQSVIVRESFLLSHLLYHSLEISSSITVPPNAKEPCLCFTENIQHLTPHLKSIGLHDRCLFFFITYFSYYFLHKPLTNSIKNMLWKKIVSGRGKSWGIQFSLHLERYCTFGLLQKLKLKLIFYCIIATKRNCKNNNVVSNRFPERLKVWLTNRLQTHTTGMLKQTEQSFDSTESHCWRFSWKSTHRWLIVAFS